MKVGDTIAKGDVVCIIEAMKFMNEVISEVDGTITEILVEDAQFVEFGQELFRVNSNTNIGRWSAVKQMLCIGI